MDQAVGGAEDELFHLADEEIPDFVMAYLQSDKGNLDEDIPDHILEYIQSRAAVLQTNSSSGNKRHHTDPDYDDDLHYTEDELRILDQARRRLEEQGELHHHHPHHQMELPEEEQRQHQDNFDQYFHQGSTPATHQVIPEEPVVDPAPSRTKKFNLKGLAKPQMNIKMPKFLNKDQKDHVEEGSRKERRPQSASPMRKKITQQLESWNNNLKRFKGRNKNQDGQVKSFVALLPGRTKSNKIKDPVENQYEEVGKPREELLAIAQDNKNGHVIGEETMEDIENLPESEIVESGTVIVDREVVDSIILHQNKQQQEFVDIDFDDDDLQEVEVPPVEPPTPATQSGLGARSLQVLQDTKSKIRTSLSKEQLEVTRNKLKKTRKKVEASTKKNFQATKSKLESTKQNLRATGEKLQTTLTSSLKKNKKSNNTINKETMIAENIIFPDDTQGIEREYETSTPVPVTKLPKNQEDDIEIPAEPPIAKTRTKRQFKKSQSQSQSTLSCKFVIEEEEEEEEEIEPRMQFSIHGFEKPAVSSVSQSTETLPEDEMESEKENVAVRPKRHRYRHRRHGFHEEFTRPRSANSEPENIRSSWVDSRPSNPSLSREMLQDFPIPAINHQLDGWTSLPRKPERPFRSKRSASSSEDHLYSNVPPPRMTKRKQHPSSSAYSTWPRGQQDASPIERPVAPKRLKLKTNKNHQTWPRRLDGSKNPPPTAPKRSRLSCQKWNKSKSAGNILTEADLLLGSESRFIDEDPNGLKEQQDSNKPKSNILMDADILFGAESRFIDEDSNGLRDEDVNNKVENNILVDADILFGMETQFINDDEEENRILLEAVPFNITVEMKEEEPKILNCKPTVPVRRNRARTLSRIRPTSKFVDESTWPRTSKPSAAPRRNKRSLQTKNNKHHLALEKPSKKLPAVPASTPLNDDDAAECSAAPSSIQAGLDHVLEILANFSQDPSSSPLNVEEENPYAEIKQFQQTKSNPPPRPPPPTHPFPQSGASSYSYIYTVPRRNRKKTTGPWPERPPRAYCTIRPHRPPRRNKCRSEETGINTCIAPEESLLSEEDSGRDLQSSPVVQRMRLRPLPPPPRSKRNQGKSPPPKPPRSTNSTLKRCPDEEAPEETNRGRDHGPAAVETEIAPFTNPVVDEYEPIENSVVDEVSVGIQTDPLPDSEDFLIEVMEESEINNNMTFNVINVDQHPPEEPEQVLWSPITSPDPDESMMERVTLKNSHPVEPDKPKQVEHIVWSSSTSPDPEVEWSSSKSPYLDSIKTLTDDSKKKDTHQDQDEESFAHLPHSLPPIRLEMPTHLHLSELDVDRLIVREVTADRLVISSVDASILQVSQMTNSSGHLVFNTGAGPAIPSIPERIDEIPSVVTPMPERIQEIPPEGPQETPPVGAPEEPVSITDPSALVTEPSVTDLTLQLVNISSRQVARATQAIAADAYLVAQRVAELGLEHVNKQLQRHGIQFDDKEKENIKAVLLMLLIVVAAIFLLGLGKQRISNHWDFYFPN